MVGKATGWKTGRCRRAQVLQLLSMEICDIAVMDFQAAMDVRMSPPDKAWRLERPAFLFSSSFSLFCQQGRRVVGGSSAV